MKSSNKSLNLELIKDYYFIISRPSNTIDKIANNAVDLFRSLIIVIISSLLLLSGVFILGGSVYNIFFEQSSSFIFEQLTSGLLLGYYISRDQYILVFISELFFCIKSWIFISLIFYILLKIFKENVKITRVLQIISWSIFPFAWIIFIVSIINLIFKLVLPLIFHLIFYGTILAVFIIAVPYWLCKFSDNLSIKTFNIYRSYYLTLFIIFILYSINHYNVLLLQMG
ncbi:MAG: hypothetical protein GF329_09845 [Candidatus Lokiarchaeota archaeon]|nr:hypothetical protein [Candidatus Lokiarchaeota archaeon]